MIVRSLDSQISSDAILFFTMNNNATKGDIERLEKRLVERLEKRLEKYATKTELKTVEKSLRASILRVEERVENLEDGQILLTQKVETIDKKLDRLQNTLDKFVGTVDDLRTDNAVGAEQIRNLDVRVTKLESPVHPV